jgi:carbamoyl-phosphate synthase large subunit
MPRRTDLSSILIIGAGPIVIGQACEFDYSGAQACKALREEGYRVILVNSNPATIMTDPGLADVTYIEPITWQVVERIIARERPDAILPTMGGQTALNCAMDLHRNGVLERHGVQLIGASPAAIEMAEDRQQFKQAMMRIGLASAMSAVAHSLPEALAVQELVGFPAVIRPSFTRRNRLQHGGVRLHMSGRTRTFTDARAANRGIAHRLERIRDGSGARRS